MFHPRALITLCPQISAPAINPKMVINSFGNRNLMQPMGKAQHALAMGPVFSFWGWGGGEVRWGNFFSFFFLLLPCSQCVPNMFSVCSIEVP